MTEKTNHLYAVIMAGGGGTRLWPLSRSEHPKQFLKLFGDKTMIQITADRARLLSDWDHIIVVTNQSHQRQVAAQLPDLPKSQIITEVEKKDTALAMLVGAIYAYVQDPQAVIINCASDHIVINTDEYKRVMRAATQIAANEPVLVTVGISPTRPETGFGYIKVGEPLAKREASLTVFQVESFTEKPNAATAKAFLATGQYFWNANMYVWSAKVLLDAFKKHQPKTYALIEPLLKLTPDKIAKQLPAIYAAATAISIDYAISEKANNLVLIPGDFQWSDIGDWKVVHELNKKDLSGNVYLSENTDTKLLSITSQNNMIYTNRLVALYGVDDLVIVDTPEVLMICPKEKSQEVKKLVERLKEEKHPDYL